MKRDPKQKEENNCKCARYCAHPAKRGVRIVEGKQRKLVADDRGRRRPIDADSQKTTTKCSEKWMGATYGDKLRLCYY